MKIQPEALRLADELEAYFEDFESARELRRLHQSEREGWRHADELEQERKRLHELNQELVEALKNLLEDTEHKNHDCDDQGWCPVISARVAIVKATGEQS